MAAIKSKNPVAPAVVLRMMLAMQLALHIYRMMEKTGA